jgi:hypothetical protein
LRKKIKPPIGARELQSLPLKSKIANFRAALCLTLKTFELFFFVCRQLKPLLREPDIFKALVK